jgi:predicted RNase H-like HicB family nuclease
MRPVLTACLAALLCASAVSADLSVRARDLGVPFDGTPGPLNAITDVAGVAVGRKPRIAACATLAETEAAIREAILFHLDGLREDASPIPPPSSRVEYIEVAA